MAFSDPDSAPLVLAVNPGSTSTKVALFRGPERVWERGAPVPDEVRTAFRGRPVLDQLEMRLASIDAMLAEAGTDPAALAAVSGRGGLLRPVASGTYRVDDAVLEDLRAARRGEHASNLGPFLARRLADAAGCPAFLVDPVSVDETERPARYSGLKGLDRECLSHALNTKAVAKRHAREQGVPYEALRLVVAHLGSGASVSAHRDGRMVDVTNSREEGPFSTERTGTLPVMRLLTWTLSEGLSIQEVERRIFQEGGIYSYLGTRDLPEVVRRIAAGDGEAEAVLEAMLYQIRKEVGAMAAVLEGRVDAVLLTGGMVHAPAVAEPLCEGLAWIAPVHLYPGEDELRALAEGALRVLSGKEQPLVYAPAAG
jgi:butyrate kinase